jgi:hypothetical protein
MFSDSVLITWLSVFLDNGNKSYTKLILPAPRCSIPRTTRVAKLHHRCHHLLLPSTSPRPSSSPPPRRGLSSGQQSCTTARMTAARPSPLALGLAGWGWCRDKGCRTATGGASAARYTAAMARSSFPTAGSTASSGGADRGQWRGGDKGMELRQRPARAVVGDGDGWTGGEPDSPSPWPEAVTMTAWS